MRILIDTHALLWLFSGDGRLSKDAKSAYLDNGNELYFSVASYWEICLKVLAKKLTLCHGWQSLLDNHLAENGIRILDISRKHIKYTIRLPLIHKDPFDRMLVAQAAIEKLTIMTKDENITRYTINTIW